MLLDLVGRGTPTHCSSLSDTRHHHDAGFMFLGASSELQAIRQRPQKEAMHVWGGCCVAGARDRTALLGCSIESEEISERVRMMALRGVP